MLALTALLLVSQSSSERFWWVAAALAFLMVGHAVFWIVTQPVNSACLKDSDLTGIGSFFFGLFAAPDSGWKHLRNVWEGSHVARSILHVLGFLSMTLGLVKT